MLKLEDSVGKGGKNRIDDVRLVQQLVNRFRPSQLSLLKVDGLAGVLTTAAIEQFQKDSLNMAMPDGLVSPIGATFNALTRQSTGRRARRVGREGQRRLQGKGVDHCRDAPDESGFFDVRDGFRNRRDVQSLREECRRQRSGGFDSVHAIHGKIARHDDRRVVPAHGRSAARLRAEVLSSRSRGGC